MSQPILMSWSGGKDGSTALYQVMLSGQYQVMALLTVLSQDYDRISHHGVRRSLLEQQASSIGLPLEEVFLTAKATNKENEAKMRELLVRYKAQGVEAVVFGDIFLEDLRTYREERLSELGMKGIFPLWKNDTSQLVQRFLELGFKTILACIDPNKIDPSFAGRIIDDRFLADLPPDVDPCGENGEFHSFVYDGPIFKNAIEFQIGEVVQRDNGNYFCDLLPITIKES